MVSLIFDFNFGWRTKQGSPLPTEVSVTGSLIKEIDVFLAGIPVVSLG